MIQDELNEFQKNRINYRMSLDFSKELIKSNLLTERKKFNQDFRNQLDILINDFYIQGVMFYYINVKMPFLKSQDPDMWYYTHLQIEDWVNMLKTEVEMIEFSYFSIELSSSYGGKTTGAKTEISDLTPQFHGIIAVRSLIGMNKDHFISIKKILVNSQTDIAIKQLNTVKKIKKYWNYVIKQNNFKFHRFVHYSKYYKMIYGEIADLELQYDPVEHAAFNLDEFSDSKHSDIFGIQCLFPKFNTIINYLFFLFFQKKEINVFDNTIFKKIEKSRYSWGVFNSIDYLRKNNINIIEELKQIYPQQLQKVRTHDLLANGWNQFYQDLLLNNHYLPNIEFTGDAIEFKDGVFFLNQNYFDQNNSSGVNCYNYFNKSYRNCKRNLPNKWLKFLEKTSKIKNIQKFCSDLGEYFHGNFVMNLNSLCISSFNSNDKIFLLSNLLIKTVGTSIYDKIIYKKKFAFEQSEDKKIVIFKESCYKSGHYSDYKDLLIDYDYESWVDKPFLIFSFNEKINDKMLSDKVFIIKLLIYAFSYKLNEKLKIDNLDKIIDAELPKIIVLCNNLFFRQNLF